MMLTKTIAIALGLIAAAHASCENGCSGHGTCGEDDACTCYQDWQMGDEDGGDCSDRKCPYEIAWVTAPDSFYYGGSGYVHSYAECAGRGICDRSSGQCECFDGYTGKGCGYTTCPNDCSGHGTCEYVNELAFGSVPGDYYDELYEGMKTADTVLSYVTTLWDAKKSRACVCDPHYTEIDCSRKMCPKGNDVMDTRLDTSDDVTYQIQNITIHAGNSAENDETAQSLYNDTFALTFKSTLNETYTTIPIVFNPKSSVDIADNYGNPTNDMAAAIEAALEGLPNYVIDAVDVNVTSSLTDSSAYSSNVGGETVSISVAFIGASVQGPQNLLMVEAAQCLDGCTPKVTGIDLESYGNALSSVTEEVAPDYNNYECGRRGKCDYDTGVCECFEGYTGLQCQVQTSLM
jgi:hypothetical protein